MRIMKELWEEKGYGYLNLPKQNLMDQAAKLEKTLGNAGQKVSQSIGTRGRGRNEESVERFQNANAVDQDLHMEESRPVPDEKPNTIGSDAYELLELSAIFTLRSIRAKPYYSVTHEQKENQ